MELLLNEQQTLLADTAVRLCRDAGGPKRARAVRDGKLETDAEAWQQAIRAGWPGILVSEQHGGSALGLFDAALAVEEAGKRLLMVPHVEAMAAAWIVSRASPGEAALGLLADHIEGRKLIVPATEAAHWRFGQGGSSGPVNFDERTSSLSGTIAFVPFASSADFFLVASGAVVALVDAAAKGVTRHSHANVDGSTAGTVLLDHVAVGEGLILARGDAAARLSADLQDALTLLTGVELLGLATEAHAITMEYIKIRQQFGRPIGSFQALQHRAVNGFIDIELNRSLVYRVLAEFDHGQHHAAMVPAVKSRTSRVASEVVRAALQLHGAVGYTDSSDIGLYYKRAIALAARYGGELNHMAHFSQLATA